MAQPLSLENPLACVWSSELDGRYLVEVQRIDDRTATFYIFDKNESYKELFSRVVPLYYGAPFGPDVEDVAKWEEMGVQFVDEGKVD